MFWQCYVFQVAGWGSSEVNGTIKPTLRWVYKQYIGYDSCRTMVNQTYRVLLAGDKFCALELQGLFIYLYFTPRHICLTVYHIQISIPCYRPWPPVQPDMIVYDLVHHFWRIEMENLFFPTGCPMFRRKIFISFECISA